MARYDIQKLARDLADVEKAPRRASLSSQSAEEAKISAFAVVSSTSRVDLSLKN